MIQIIEQQLKNVHCEIVRPYVTALQGLALHSRYTPKVIPDLDTRVLYEIDLLCEANITVANETICRLAATHYAKIQVGMDVADNAERLDKVLMVILPNTLANDARATISRLSVMAGYPQVVIPMQNFAGLLAKMRANRPVVPSPLKDIRVTHAH